MNERRVIIEGCFEDTVGISSVYPTKLNLEDDVTRINIRPGSDRLMLVYQWVDQYLMDTDPFKDKGKEFNFASFDKIPWVTSLISEDGRVFINCNEHFSDTQRIVRARFQDFITRLKDRTDGTNPVGLFFTPEGRARFRNSPIEVYT